MECITKFLSENLRVGARSEREHEVVRRAWLPGKSLRLGKGNEDDRVIRLGQQAALLPGDEEVLRRGTLPDVFEGLASAHDDRAARRKPVVVGEVEVDDRSCFRGVVGPECPPALGNDVVDAGSVAADDTPGNEDGLVLGRRVDLRRVDEARRRGSGIQRACGIDSTASCSVAEST